MLVLKPENRSSMLLAPPPPPPPPPCKTCGLDLVKRFRYSEYDPHMTLDIWDVPPLYEESLIGIMVPNIILLKKGDNITIRNL